MNDIKKLSDIELCKEHAHWLGQCRYYYAAEGGAWDKEASERIRANDNFKKYDEEVEKRGITSKEVHVEENRFVSLRTRYATKDDKEILIA